MSQPANNLKSGFVVVIGMSSAGKSTFINAIVGEKISIVSSKRQSTRTPMRGIYTDDKMQAIFIDTPGYFTPKDKLEEYMLNSMKNSISGADILMLMVDITVPIRSVPAEFIDIAKRSKLPKILVISKIDKVSDFKISENMDLLNLSTYFDETIAVSAVNKMNIEKVKSAIYERIPYGPMLYPEDELTDVSSQFIISEIVRESICDITHDEIPYSVAVNCDELTERESRKYYIFCTIYVERESQKGIIIGKNGLGIKKIGTRSRELIEKVLEISCFLELKVKVVDKWRKNDRFLRMLGYYVDRSDT